MQRANAEVVKRIDNYRSIIGLFVFMLSFLLLLIIIM